MVVRTEADLQRSLQGFLYILKKSLLGMLIVAVLLGGSVYTVCKKLVTPIYQSTSSIYIVSASNSVLQFSDFQIGNSIIDDYIYLITSRPFITAIKEELKLSQYTVSELRSMITVTNPNNTHALEITVENSDEALAADIANCLADYSVMELSDIMETSHPKVTMYATVRHNQVSPNSMLNALISAVLGAIIYLSIAIVRYLSDDTVRTAEDIDMFLELNVLGIINDNSAQKDENKRKRKQRKKDKKTNNKNKDNTAKRFAKDI